MSVWGQKAWRAPSYSHRPLLPHSVFYKNSLVDVSELEGSEEGGMAVLANRRVVQLSPGDKEVVLDNGAKIRFSKCLIATG